MLQRGFYWKECYYQLWFILSADDESKRKIKVEIKPVRANGAATPSFDELSSVIGKLELAPPPVAVSLFYFKSPVKASNIEAH